MPELPIPFPQNGVSDTFSYEAQPPGTTVDSLNVRAVDGVTGRVRGAQREGLDRVTPNALGGSKVQALTTVTYDGRQVQFENNTTATPDDLTLWSKSLNASTTGEGSGVNTIAIDVSGNVYTIVGNASLVKYNSAGAQQWEFDLPVKVANHVVRALAVDDFGGIYVGVSEGTTAQEFTWIRRYVENAEGVLDLQWSVSPGAYVEKLVVRNDKIYAALNYTDAGKSQVAAYEFIYSAGPEIARAWYVPYPVNDFALTDSGEVITAHRQADTIFVAAGTQPGNRSFDPRSSPETGHIVEPSAMRWDPTKLENWEDRKWVWLNGDTIKQQQGYEAIRDGEDVNLWQDILGAGEVVFSKGLGSSDIAPKYISSGLAGRPGVHFKGNNYRMETLGTKRLLPGANADEAYLLVMVVKPTGTEAVPQALLYQDSAFTSNSKPLFAQYWVPSASATQYESPNGDNGITGKTRFDTIIALNALCGVPVLDQSFIYDAGGSPASYSNISNVTYGRRIFKNDRFYLASTLTGTAQIVSKKGQDNYGIARYGTAVDGTATFSSTPASRAVSFIDWHRFTGTAGYISVMGESLQNEDHSNAGAGEYNDPKEAYGRFWVGETASPGEPVRPMIVSMLIDNEKCDGGNDVSLFRVNGMPLSKWRSVKHANGVKPTVIGKLRTSDSWPAGDQSHGMDHMLNNGGGIQANFLGLDAEIYEIFVIKQYKDGTVTKVCTFPGYNANAFGTNPAYVTSSDTELEKIEAYFAWKYGIAHLLDQGTGAADSAPAWDAQANHYQAINLGRTQYGHPYGIPAIPSATTTAIVGGPPTQSAKDQFSIDRYLWTSAYTMMVKWNFQRGPRWIRVADSVGYGVAVNGSSVFSVGPVWPSGSGYSVRLFTDLGATTAPVANFQTNLGGTAVGYANDAVRIECDKYGRCWVPAYWEDASGSTFNTHALFAFKAPASGTTLDIDFQYKVISQTPHRGLCVAIDRTSVEYGDDAASITRPEAVVLGTEAYSVDGKTLHYIDLVGADFIPGAKARNTTWVGVCGGDIKTFTSASSSTPANGTGALSASSRYVNAVTAFSKVYFSDGRKYKVYDPVQDEVSEWAATTAGRIPEACRLMTFWRGRMVLARGPDDPHNWHMSAVGDPNDWDQFPPDSPLETQAISGNNSIVGSNHDIINALIPYDRERLIFGGDHTIHMMWGDPMAGGMIALLTDVTGISFGSGWCKDSSGILYFYGSRGGVYAMAPGGGADRVSNHPQKISSETIDRKLSAVNLETHYLGMVWDDIEQRLYLYQMPYGTNASPMDSWCWEKKTGAWWVDRFGNVGLSPTALCVLDGDASDDRVIAIGCQDGVVRYPSGTAKTDDGTAIDSYVTIGPFFSGNSTLRVRNPKITLARDQGGCWVELLSSDTADVRGEPVQRALLGPGQNSRQMIGTRGAFCWLRLRNAAPGSRWAYESGVIEAISANRKRAP
jgi:hypothetical protein